MQAPARLPAQLNAPLVTEMYAVLLTRTSVVTLALKIKINAKHKLCETLHCELLLLTLMLNCRN